MAKSLGLRRNLAKDQRERALKEAALKVFSAKGYHRATMSEIALEAGFGKGTLYWYWRSKEELYFSLIEDMHREFLRLVEEAAAGDEPALEKLKKLGLQVVDLYYRMRDYCKLSWKMRAEELETFSPQYVERLQDYVKRTKRTLTSIMEQGIREGVFPPHDPYYLACILMGLVEGLEIQWLEDSRAFDLRKGMQIVLDFFEGAFSPSRPVEEDSPRPLGEIGRKGERGSVDGAERHYGDKEVET